MRYSVKCSMAKHAAITKAAARAGLSVTQFVQAHFETILDERRAAKADALSVKVGPQIVSALDDLARARKNGLTISQMRIYDFMVGHTDENGIYASGLDLIATSIGFHGSTQTISVQIGRLASKGALENVSTKFGRKQGFWRVHDLSEVNP